MQNLQQFLKVIASIMGIGSFLFLIIVGTSITDGRIIIDLEAGIGIAIYPAVISLALIVLMGIMD
ncbi:MAG: hypothetical protein HFJ19_03165 [Clostridia bacterium]|nr:hypothetical protein [Clostridia bacterium]